MTSTRKLYIEMATGVYSSSRYLTTHLVHWWLSLPNVPRLEEQQGNDEGTIEPAWTHQTVVEAEERGNIKYTGVVFYTEGRGSLLLKLCSIVASGLEKHTGLGDRVFRTI